MSSVNILLCSQRLLVNAFKSSVLHKQHILYALNKNISNWHVQSRSVSNSFHHDFNTGRAVNDEAHKNKIFNGDHKDTHLNDDHDPDVFGTMDKNFELKRKLEELPEEEDDVSETILYNEKDERRGRLTMNKYGKIIKYFLNKKKLGNAIDVLETRMLKEDKAKPDKYIYNLLISGCAKFGYTRKAFQLFNDMKKRGLQPSSSTYTSLFNACSTSPWTHDGVKRLKGLRELILEKGYIPNQQNYHAMIKAFGRCKDLESAFNVVDEMIERNVLVTTETFNFLLQACITDEEAGLRHAILVWNKMLSKGLKPDLYSFNLILRCTRDCGLGSLEATSDVIQTVIGSSQGTSKFLESSNSKISSIDNNVVENDDIKLLATPEENVVDSLKYNHELVENRPNLLSRHPHLGDIIGLTDIKLAEHRLILLGGFEGVIREMKLNGVKPDIKTFTQLLEAIPSTLSAEKILLKSMEENKLKPDIDFFNILVKKRSMRCDYESSREVLKLIQKHLLSPDIVTFGVLALSCFTVEDVNRLIQDMDAMGYRMNIQILGALLRNACVSWNIDCTVKIMRLLLDENITPSPQFMSYLWLFYSSVLKYKKLNENKHFNENDKKFIDKVNDKDFMDQFQHYCIFFKKWKYKALPAKFEHPFAQFQKHDLDSEELAVLNTGRSSR